jgi:hypothetical protein
MTLWKSILTAAWLPGILAAGEGVPLPPCTTGRVAQVALPGATCLAVSETLRLAVVAHRGPTDFQLTALPLGPAGDIEPGSASRVTLEKPESLKAFTVSAQGLAFHPVLPLLYVWREVAYPFPPGKRPDNPVFRDFDHLAVYAVSNRTLVPAGAFARGPDFAYGFEAGSLALDPAGRRLFVPNIRSDKERGGIGYLPITTNGYPLVEAGTGVKLISAELADFTALPAGRSLACFNERVACLGVPCGLMVWDTGNRLGAVSRVLLFGWPDKPLLAGCHPFVPAFYMASGNYLGMIAAADGYPTLLPVSRTVPNAAFSGAPVVLPAPPAAVAVGGINAVHLFGIDPATGGFTGNDAVVAVTNPAVRAMAASAAWNRLYVAVEALP